MVSGAVCRRCVQRGVATEREGKKQWTLKSLVLPVTPLFPRFLVQLFQHGEAMSERMNERDEGWATPAGRAVSRGGADAAQRQGCTVRLTTCCCAAAVVVCSCSKAAVNKESVEAGIKAVKVSGKAGTAAA